MTVVSGGKDIALSIISRTVRCSRAREIEDRTLDTKSEE